jgi:hypothetical protein
MKSRRIGGNAKMVSEAYYKVALLKWDDSPGDIESAIHYELTNLGHRTVYFKFDEAIPLGVDVVFSFAPYREFLQIPRQLEGMPHKERPTFVHWNTEGLVNLSIPHRLSMAIGAFRSWVGRLNDSKGRLAQILMRYSPLYLISSGMRGSLRLGDYYYAHRRGWFDVFADISAVYARRFAEHGLPAIHAPFGTSPLWYADLNLERDIDVLWMGMRGTRRRSKILDHLHEKLNAHGVRFHVADRIKNPFVFGEERTRLLNRAKITVNILRTWWSENSLRFAFAAPNRSLIVSERILPHSPAYKPGIHYVSAPVEKLAESILYYLDHEEERLRIVESAYHFATKEMTFGNSIRIIMEAVRKARESMP